MATDNDNTERERLVAELLRSAAQTERAPDTLQARITAMRARSSSGHTVRPRRAGMPRPMLNLIRVAVPTVAAAIAALVLTLGGGAGAPSIAQAASLATRSPSRPAPAPDPSSPMKLLAVRVGSLHFPNWRAAGGWRSVGQRFDRVGNRTVTTVYYANGRTQIAYSIVSSPTLARSSSAGEPYRTIWRNGRTTVVWVEQGHTCLLSGTAVSAARLWQLASVR